MEVAQGIMRKLETAILFPLMKLMMAAAVIVFLWGAYQMILNAEDGGERESGRKNMLYGIIGLLVMISAYTLLKIAADTFGVKVPGK